MHAVVGAAEQAKQGGCGCEPVDETVAVVAACCPNLEHFDCPSMWNSRATTLTDAAVMVLIMRYPKLTHLNLQCHRCLTDDSALAVRQSEKR
jgi:hypothetical protein